MLTCDVLIIGGGIIGGSIAYELSQYKVKVIMCESNPVLADETTSANSGVIHGGFDPVPGTMTAKLNFPGNRKWVNSWFADLDFPRKQVDSLVVAYAPDELAELAVLEKRAFANGLNRSQLKKVSKKELRSLEPLLSDKAEGALLCNISWIIDPVKATLCLVGAAEQNGLSVRTDARIVSISKKKGVFVCFDQKQTEYRAKVVINAAGHNADLIAKIAGYEDFTQTTRRGEYRILSRTLGPVVSHICFMTPDKHGKGVVVAPMLNGNILIGPTALDGVPKDQTKVVTQEMYDKIGGIAHKIIPSLDIGKTVMTLAGSRPIDVATNDFVIRAAKGEKSFINAAGMQSPGISSAPCIAQMVVELVRDADLLLAKRKDFRPAFSVK